jgi:hypothetical protein
MARGFGLGFRYIPEGYTPHTPPTPRTDGAIAYVQDFEGPTGKTLYYAKGFRSDKQINDDFNFRFTTNEQREKFLNNWYAGLDANLARKQAKKDTVKLAKTKGHPFKVGTILVNSWGYEQTNIDFYKVTEQNGDNLTIVAIGCKTRVSTAWEQHDVTPDPDKVLEGREAKTLKKRVMYSAHDGKPYITAEHGCMSVTHEGQVHHETSYA